VSNNQTPEQKARNDIDRELNGSGWIVQEKSKIGWSASRGIAVKEYLTDLGPADYVLFVEKSRCDY
jgi:Type I site-specific restriction-modification system, R (restriction) subunit and related helicases